MIVRLEEMQDYNFWQKHTAQEVLDFATMLGGWRRVFPSHMKPFPEWASRVRNFFNVYPAELELLNPYFSHLPEKVRANIAPKRHEVEVTLRKQGISLTTFGATIVFDDQVYLDEMRRPWFLYGTAGSAFHYESRFPNDAKIRRGGTAAITPRDLFPVFKLVSPDKAGGSSEIIIHNWEKEDGGRSDTIRDMRPGGPAKTIKNHIVVKPEYRASYNYTCAMFTSNSGHTFRDVDPDKVGMNPFFLVQPQKTASLMSRRFPRTHKGKELAGR